MQIDAELVGLEVLALHARAARAEIANGQLMQQNAALKAKVEELEKATQAKAPEPPKEEKE